jgi:DNA-binding GntR family transcriptional regulator
MLINITRKLRKRTLRERIYDEVVRMIASRELPSDELIKEKHLIQKLQVTRTPFREVVGILAKEGLIQIIPHRGFYVRSFSRKETDDLYVLKRRIECLAVELAIPRMRDRDIATLELLAREATDALKRGDMKTYAARDEEFYKAIAAQSGNEPLIDTLARLALQIKLCETSENQSQSFAEGAANQLDDVLQAFKARDIPRATFLVSAQNGDRAGDDVCASDKMAINKGQVS